MIIHGEIKDSPAASLKLHHQVVMAENPILKAGNTCYAGCYLNNRLTSLI